jgi:hypothetical protein
MGCGNRTQTRLLLLCWLLGMGSFFLELVWGDGVDVGIDFEKVGVGLTAGVADG